MFRHDRSILPKDWTTVHPSVIERSKRQGYGIPLHIPAPMPMEPTDRPPVIEDGNINFEIDETVYSV